MVWPGGKAGQGWWSPWAGGPASEIFCDLLCGKRIGAVLEFIEEMVLAKRVAATIHGFKKSCDLLCANGVVAYLEFGRQTGTAKRVAGKI